ncbi:MAG: hypothetical protein R3336_07505, partial [Phycisphaeraceae bacterium]|nr:hypothetical protein [Phycisphaeraceae bacterium]
MASGRKQLPAALGFLLPNIIGVLIFTVFPVLFAIVLAFTNWDLRRHNMFKDEPLEFVGFDNFVRLVTEADFFRFLGNTLFLMMAIPFAVGGSLVAAILLSKETRGGGGRTWAWVLASAGLVISAALLAALGLGATGMTILLLGVACGILAMGVVGGQTVYRTLFYMPHFTAGVATFLLWKKLYNPETGPINAALQPVLDVTATVVNASPAATVASGQWVWLAVMVGLIGWALDKFRRMWRDGDLGGRAVVGPVALVFIPVMVAPFWPYGEGPKFFLQKFLSFGMATPVYVLLGGVGVIG